MPTMLSNHRLGEVAPAMAPLAAPPDVVDRAQRVLTAYFIREAETVKEALKRLDKTSEKVLIVVDDRHCLLGTLSDGDIRRHLLDAGSLEDPVRGIYNSNPRVLHHERVSIEEAKKLMLEYKIEVLPIIDGTHRVVEFISWSEAFSDHRRSHAPALDIPVIIMAGGRGTRLEPFTKIFPKPLIPLGDKPIIEVIMDEFRQQGVRQFYITLNYKAEMVEAYFNSVERDYEITFIREESFLGTVGAVRLLRDRLDGPFILTNCDTVVRANFSSVVALHKAQDSWLTILSALRHYEIPYGVVKYGQGGEILELVEKPECTFTINTGCYVLDSRCIEYLPEEKCDMPDLINTLIAHGRKAITYPVNESDFMDIGQWEEYRRTAKHFETL